MQIRSLFCPIPLSTEVPLSRADTRHPHSPETEQSILHYHDSLELGVCIKGSGVFYIGTECLPFSAGDVSVIGSGIVHIAKSTKHDISQWYFMNVDIARLLGCKDSLPSGIFSPRLRIADYISDLFYDDSNDIKIASALITLILNELRKTGIDAAHFDNVLYERISPALAHITQHYDEQITEKQLASLCFMSEVTFRRIFSACMGVSPFEYLYRVRTKIASALLKSGNLSIGEIAFSVGYRSLSSFNRHFKKHTGVPPSNVKNVK